jgi:hypothetical protein
MSEDHVRTVVLTDWDDDEVERVLTNGVTVCIEGTPTVLVRNESGEIDELSPEVHRAYEEVGSIHGTPAEPDEVDLDGDNFRQGHLGRIGSVYFQYDKDAAAWEWCGEFDSDEEAIEYVCGGDFYFEPNA